MWQRGWRDQVWSELDTHWDLVVVGGGITGAGILREAVHAGYKTLLVEAQDFSAGTSSRSSKLVHGGFRYMANAQFKLTYESVHERELLLRDGHGLVDPLDILMLNLPGSKVPAWELGLGLLIYSLMAGKLSFRYLDRQDLVNLCPRLTNPKLRGAFRYYDANTDDARLTLRVIREAVSNGGAAVNYARAVDLLRDGRGRVCGIVLADQTGEKPAREVQASLVVNATGAWADELRTKLGQGPRLRPLQGSHLVLPFARLPVSQSVSIFHPSDSRPVFTLPWEGVTLVGTTDVDVNHSLPGNPTIKEREIEYLLQAIQYAFPEQEIQRSDVLCTMSGIRPVIDTGKADPSKESREHALWLENGMLTVTGGKLTTFRLMARDVLRIAGKVLSPRGKFTPGLPLLDTQRNYFGDLTYTTLDPEVLIRLAGRYGADSREIFAVAQPGELEQIEHTPYLWSELRWAARDEGVLHLEDLLLRRVRLGLLLRDGARDLLPRIKEIAQPELGWDDQRWDAEQRAYLELWENAYKMKSS
jgi:glycerol-3-phosphate dehydrogenase